MELESSIWRTANHIDDVLERQTASIDECTVALGERIRAAVAEASFPIRCSPDPIRLTVSVGIAVVEAGQPGDVGQLIRLAEDELDDAKARRRRLT